MKRVLPWLVLWVCFSVEAKKPPPKPKPVEKPAPVVEEQPEDAPPDDTFDLPDPDPAEDDEVAGDTNPAPRTNKQDSTGTTSSKKRRNSDLTDDQAAALGFASICCCLLFVVGLVALIVWLVKRGKGSPPPQATGPVPPGVPSMGRPAPHAHAPPPPTGAAGMMQLSIFALALEPSARQVVEDALATAGVAAVPTTADGRGRLVREAARALLLVQPSWRQFGYGEKPGIPDLAGAELSYRTASEDFRQRSAAAGATSDAAGGLVVVTLLICCRRALLGVSRLDDPMQVRNVLEDRMKVGDAELLGTELLWAPVSPGGKVTESEISLRFPEMLPLIRG